MKNLDTRKLNLLKLKWIQEIGPHIWMHSLGHEPFFITGNRNVLYGILRYIDHDTFDGSDY